MGHGRTAHKWLRIAISFALTGVFVRACASTDSSIEFYDHGNLPDEYQSLPDDL